MCSEPRGRQLCPVAEVVSHSESVPEHPDCSKVLCFKNVQSVNGPLPIRGQSEILLSVHFSWNSRFSAFFFFFLLFISPL